MPACSGSPSSFTSPSVARELRREVDHEPPRHGAPGGRSSSAPRSRNGLPASSFQWFTAVNVAEPSFRLLLGEILVDDLAALHVPAVVGLAADGDLVPADEDAAVVRICAAGALGDRRFAVGVEDVQERLERLPLAAPASTCRTRTCSASRPCRRSARRGDRRACPGWRHPRRRASARVTRDQMKRQRMY